MKICAIEPLLPCLRENIFGFCKTVEVQERKNQGSVRRSKIGIEVDRLAGFRDGLIELSNLPVGQGKVRRSAAIARVRSVEQRQHVDPLAQVPGGKTVIEIGDAQLLVFAHPIPELIALFCIFSGESWSA